MLVLVTRDAPSRPPNLNPNGCYSKMWFVSISVAITLFVTLADASSSNATASDRVLLEGASHSALHVSAVYTYGSPSVGKGPHMSNPGDRCVPGLRIYTENVKDETCSWWQLWCTPGRAITDVDFASQVNLDSHYPHAKTDTLVLRLVLESNRLEYTYHRCSDANARQQYNYQWLPDKNSPSDLLPGLNIHSPIDKHYGLRLRGVPRSIRGDSLEFLSVARCSHELSDNGIRECLNRLGGIDRLGYEPFAFMVHASKMMLIDDTDTVYVLKKDDSASRRCVIAFQGSDSVFDLSKFLMQYKDPRKFCGRSGIHSGVADELSGITRNPQFGKVIVPALETCDDVVCVGHSLGGSLCSLFADCANNGLQNLIGSSDSEMWSDYKSLTWRRK
mmetsp:Transcript_4642/g.10344  ORF Transcript_4642/g.10344 Transcript_4642/m.10344 type:complete len:389 (+) Transcript_4642:42-1208(+)